MMEYMLFIIAMWFLATLLMAVIGYDTFDQAEELRHRREYYDYSEAELLMLEERERREGAWIFILSPLAPLVLVFLVVFGIRCGLYFVGKFFFTTFPEMIRALR